MTQDKQLEDEITNALIDKLQPDFKVCRNHYDYADARELLTNYAAQLERKQSGVWVKASERLPELNWKGVMDIDGLYHNSDGAKIKWYFQTYPNCVIQWLDEHPQQPTLEAIAGENEVMMQAFDKVRQLFERRSWIMDGRGCYPYNDDRYKEEVRYLYDEFDALKKDVWANIKTKTFEYREKIIADYKAQSATANQPTLEAISTMAEKEFELKFGRKPSIMGSMEADAAWLNTFIKGFKSALGYSAGDNWISVGERLPEEEQEVNIYFRNEAGWHVTGCYWDGKNFIELCERCGFKEPYSHLHPITHWQPLPKPPIKKQ